MKIRIIAARVKDDADYDWIYDQALQNTLNDYFKWAEPYNGNISFIKSWGDPAYDLILNVDAKFEDKETFALFKLTYGDRPFNKLDTNKMEFVHV
jgi:hypothetical protein|tara:strand:- start:796 stop:1080 length:285 start_codon:yes stop_codon:yes gene_type:complete